MKTLKLENDQHNFLKNLAKTIQDEQENLSPTHITTDPCFCVYRKDYCIAETDFYDDNGWVDDEGDWIGYDNIFGFVKQKLRDGYEFKNRTFDEIMDELDMRSFSRKEIDVFVGAYLTQIAAQKHIDQNHYHYHKPFIFVNSFWRNCEMISLRNLLLDLKIE